MTQFIGAVALIGLFTGAVACGLSGSLAPDPDDSVHAVWHFLGEVPLESVDGTASTPAFVVPDGAAGFAMFVEMEGCGQVAQLETDRLWVETLEGGASCATCEERFSMVSGSGLWVHEPRERAEGDARVRVGRLDCRTLSTTLLDDVVGDGIRVWYRDLPDVPAESEVRLRLWHGPFSAYASEAATGELVARIRALMAPAGVEVVLSASQFEDVPEDLAWFEGVPNELAAVVPPPDTFLTVVLGGCLERVHPEIGSRTVLDGLVPRVPAFGAVGAGIFIRGTACVGTPRAIEWSVETLARRIAHEMGHYLGLYHSQEVTSGVQDRLPDTEADTLMAPNPTLVDAPVFSPLQSERMRIHARLIHDGLPAL